MKPIPGKGRQEKIPGEPGSGGIMISRIDHVAMAVQDYDGAFDFFTRVFGAVPCTSSQDDALQYTWQILALGDLSRIELLRPTGEKSFLGPFLRNRIGGVHHITMQTPDIEQAREHLEEHSVPYFGFNDVFDIWKELFIHPRDAYGTLIQIAEFEADDWLSESVKMHPDRKWEIEQSDDGCTATFAHPGGATVKITLSRDDLRSLIRDLEEAL